MPDLGIAYAAQHTAEAQLAEYAEAPGIAVRRGRDWFAVRTGVDSNDMNGVVSQARAEFRLSWSMTWLRGFAPMQSQRRG